MYMKHSVIVAAAALGFSTLGQIAFAGPAPFAGETAYQAQPAFTQVSNHSADAWRIRRYCRHHLAAVTHTAGTMISAVIPIGLEQMLY